MRRGLFILAVFILMAMSSRDAHAVLLFGTKDKVEHLQDLNAKGPNGEALYLGYLVSTHSFMLPYSMSGDYVLVVRGARDIFYKLPQEKIEQMQRTGALPNPLPVYRYTIGDYILGYTLWLTPLVFVVLGFFSTSGRGSGTRSETRSV
jgi:hypothetical protein